MSFVDGKTDLRAGEDLIPGPTNVSLYNVEGGPGLNGGCEKFCGSNADPIRCFQLCDVDGEWTRVKDLQRIWRRGECGGKRCVLSSSAQSTKSSAVKQGPQQANMKRPRQGGDLLSPDRVP